MSQTRASFLGFMTLLPEGTGFLGGYLVTNPWGRPIEFRLSTAVQPNKVQQILYGPTLAEYLCSEVIGKTLVEKTSTAAGLIFTDHTAALALRARVEVPVLWVSQPGSSVENSLQRPLPDRRSNVYLSARDSADLERAAELLAQLDDGLDLAEPFARVREAVAEARKMGVTRSA
jgi:hypothetical protein